MIQSIFSFFRMFPVKIKSVTFGLIMKFITSQVTIKDIVRSTTNKVKLSCVLLAAVVENCI